MKKTPERDREATEKRLLEALGALIRESGFERIGVNAVSARSGVSKILIYRYFGSIEGLMAAYIRRYDFWLNISAELPAPERLPEYLKAMLRRFAGRLRSDTTLKRLYRWELSTDNELIRTLREQRERIGLELIARIGESTGLPQTEIAVIASFLTASVTYLVMLEEFCPVYNGIPIGEDAGWDQICRGMDGVIDRVFER